MLKNAVTPQHLYLFSNIPDVSLVMRNGVTLRSHLKLLTTVTLLNVAFRLVKDFSKPTWTDSRFLRGLPLTSHTNQLLQILSKFVPKLHKVVMVTESTEFLLTCGTFRF